jgi:hypothetical protein
VCVDRSNLIVYFTALPLCPNKGFGNMEDLNAEMELLRSLSSRTPRFTAVDDLPLDQEDPAERRHASVEILDRFGGPQAQNQYFQGLGVSDARSDTRGVSSDFLASQFPRFSRAPDSQLEVFPFSVPSEAVSRGGDFSVRRASGVENVTTRETKRPKERE